MKEEMKEELKEKMTKWTFEKTKELYEKAGKELNGHEIQLKCLEVMIGLIHCSCDDSCNGS